MRFRETPPPPAAFLRDQARLEAKLQQVSGARNDAATRNARQRQQSAMRSVHLGGLANAVKAKTGRSKDRAGNPNAYGVIYAADGDESRAGQALQAYSRGTVIRPVNGPWLWFQTDALARTAKVPGDAKRGRMTPERYRRLGNPLGPLMFAKLSPDFAKLYVEVADISIRNGRASRPGKRLGRTKVRTRRVTIFYGIRITRRGQRYDPLKIVAQAHAEIPKEIAADMAAYFANPK